MHGSAPLDASGESNKVDSGIGHKLLQHAVLGEVEHLEDIVGQAGREPGGQDALGGAWGLRGGLEQDCVSAEDGGEDRVDGREVGEVPGGDDSETGQRDRGVGKWKRQKERGKG